MYALAALNDEDEEIQDAAIEAYPTLEAQVLPKLFWNLQRPLIRSMIRNGST